MIITAMYIYGISQHSWEFSWLLGVMCFAMDIMLSYVISPNVNVRVKADNDISNEEKYYWNKKGQVEELMRVKLDRELYGGK